MNTTSLCRICSFFILLVLLSCKKEVDSIKGVYRGSARQVRYTYTGTPELDTLYNDISALVSESTDSKRHKVKIDITAAAGQSFSWESVPVTNGGFDRNITHYQGRAYPARYSRLQGGFKNDSLNFLIEETELGSLYMERWEFKTVKQ